NIAVYSILASAADSKGTAEVSTRGTDSEKLSLNGCSPHRFRSTRWKMSTREPITRRLSPDGCRVVFTPPLGNACLEGTVRVRKIPTGPSALDRRASCNHAIARGGDRSRIRRDLLKQR